MAPAAAYRVAADRVQAEVREKGSRFLAIVEPARDENAVRDQIRAYRQDYAAASHVCWAWRIGFPPKEGRSDAGEPAGTAGTPMLQVLRGSDLSDVLVVVIRWFGGVKLGKGGLARAYAGAVREAVDTLTIVERRPVVRLRVCLPYDRVGDIKRLIRPPIVELLEESYTEGVCLVLEIESHYRQEFEEAVSAFVTSVESAGS